MISAKRMDDALLPLLPSLIALIDEGGVGRAAKRLGISQPRMSARLATLRTVLDDPVLVSASGTRGLIATDRARQIAEAARRTLRDLDAAVAGGIFNAAHATRTFAIMAKDNGATIVGLPLVEAIRTTSGTNVRVSLQQFDLARLSDLESGRIGLVLGAPAQFERMAALMTSTVVRDRFVSVARRDDPSHADLDSYCTRGQSWEAGSEPRTA